MIQILKWTAKKPDKSGLYWHRSMQPIQDAPVEAAEGCLMRIIWRGSMIDEKKLVATYSTALNTSHISYVYLENMGGEWAEFNQPYLDTEDIRILVDSLALNTGLSIQNATEADEILTLVDGSDNVSDELKQVRNVLENARRDVAAARALSDKLGLLFDEAEPAG